MTSSTTAMETCNYTILKTSLLCETSDTPGHKMCWLHKLTVVKVLYCMLCIKVDYAEHGQQYIYFRLPMAEQSLLFT